MEAERQPGHRSLEVAVEAARAAARVLCRGPGKAVRKPDGSLVSDADLAAEAAVREVLGGAFPDDGVLGEELGGPAGTDRERCWVVDPLDNTACHLRGSPEYAVIVGLLAKGRPVLGVVVTPHDGAVWRAAEGEGAWGPDGRRLRCSGAARLEEATITYASLKRWRALGLGEALGRVADAAFHESLHGGFRGMLAVASGTVDLCLDPWGKLWDHAGLVPLLRESGARCARLATPAGPAGLVAGAPALLRAVRDLGLPVSGSSWTSASYRRVETAADTVETSDTELPTKEARP